MSFCLVRAGRFYCLFALSVGLASGGVSVGSPSAHAHDRIQGDPPTLTQQLEAMFGPSSERLNEWLARFEQNPTRVQKAIELLTQARDEMKSGGDWEKTYSRAVRLMPLAATETCSTLLGSGPTKREPLERLTNTDLLTPAELTRIGPLLSLVSETERERFVGRMEALASKRAVTSAQAVSVLRDDFLQTFETHAQTLNDAHTRHQLAIVQVESLRDRIEATAGELDEGVADAFIATLDQAEARLNKALQTPEGFAKAEAGLQLLLQRLTREWSDARALSMIDPLVVMRVPGDEFELNDVNRAMKRLLGHHPALADDQGPTAAGRAALDAWAIVVGQYRETLGSDEEGTVQQAQKDLLAGLHAAMRTIQHELEGVRIPSPPAANLYAKISHAPLSEELRTELRENLSAAEKLYVAGYNEAQRLSLIPLREAMWTLYTHRFAQRLAELSARPNSAP